MSKKYDLNHPLAVGNIHSPVEKDSYDPLFTPAVSSLNFMPEQILSDAPTAFELFKQQIDAQRKAKVKESIDNIRMTMFRGIT